LVLVLAVGGAGCSPRSELFEAVSAGDPHAVRRALADGADVNERNRLGQTPLHYARTRDVAAVLVAHGADVHAKDKAGCTPLHILASFHVDKTIEFLIGVGANVNARNEKGQTPLHVAGRCSATRVYELLVRCGADVTAQDDDGHPPTFVPYDEDPY